MFYNIYKPNKEDVVILEAYEITYPHVYNYQSNRVKRNSSKTQYRGIPMEEWRRRLAMAPEDFIKNTLEATTKHYLSVEV